MNVIARSSGRGTPVRRWRRALAAGAVPAAVATMLLSGGPVASAQSTSLPTSTTTPSHRESAPAKQSIDDLFSSVAEAVPTFAGAYVDPDRGEFVVRVRGADPDAGSAAAQVLRRRVFRGDRDLGRLRVMDADHTFPELRAWYQRMRPHLLPLDGVEMTDIDERGNRIVVGTSSSEGDAAVARQVAALGVPSDVVETQRHGPIELESSLTDKHRPLVGGVRTTRPVGGGTISNCTLGFNAVRNGVAGYVTNSHCTSVKFGADSSAFYQVSTLTEADRIGTATVDPPMFSGGDYCVWPGYVCRWSDSAFVKRTTGVSGSLGRIARPALNATAWNGVDTFAISQEAYTSPQGAAVTKVGQATGRTQGYINYTCADIDYNLTLKQVLLCQEGANYASTQGDSGSPVFRIWNGGASTYVTLAGIHFGTGSQSGVKWYSPLGYGVEDDLGSLTTCVSGC